MTRFTCDQRMNFLLLWECKLCPTKSSTFLNLRWHIIDEHMKLDDNEQHICMSCNLTYDNFNQYFEHTISKHFIEEFECKVCGQVFATPETSIEHYNNIQHKREELGLYWINNPHIY